MPDVDKDLEHKEDEDLELEDQEKDQDQDDLQGDDDQNDDVEEEEKEDEEQDEDDSDESEQDEEEEPRKPSRRESLRIQELLGKIKENDTPAKPRKEDDADKTIFDDEDRSKEYEQKLESVYRFTQFETRLEVDAPRVEAKYPQLDKTSDEFNPVLADTVNRMFLSFVGFDPKNRSVRTSDIRYAEYVDSVYELANEIAGDSVERTTTNIKRQASKTGVRPGGSSTKRLNLNKAPQDMNDEELEAAIKASMPKR